MIILDGGVIIGLLFLLPVSILPGVTISYDNLGTFTDSSYLASGVEVAGTGDLNFLNANESVS